MFGNTTFLLQCLRLMFKPVVRFCLRHSLKIQECEEQLRLTFLEIAAEDMQQRDLNPSVGRLAVMTGIYRREVDRLYKRAEVVEETGGLVMRVINRWQINKKWHNKSGKPRTLSVNGPDSEFCTLVRSISQDVKPGTVLLEMERVGAVEHTSDGLRLVASSYVPKGNVGEGLALLTSDVSELTQSVEENIFSPAEIPNLHGKVVFDNVREDAEPLIRKWLVREGSSLLKRARNFIAKFDQDLTTNPLGKKKSVRVALGTFSLISEGKVNK